MFRVLLNVLVISLADCKLTYIYRPLAEELIKIARTQADAVLHPERWTIEGHVKLYYFNSRQEYSEVATEGRARESLRGGFNFNLPFTVIIPGRFDVATDAWLVEMGKQLCQQGQTNVLLLNWMDLSHLQFALASIPAVGRRFEYLIRRTFYDVPPGRFRFVGVAEGCEIASVAGRMFGGRVGRLFCLSPLVPHRTYFPDRRDCVSPADALSVQVMHMQHSLNGNQVAVLGHQDWYVNYPAFPQPGCLDSADKWLQIGCSNAMARQLFYNSIGYGDAYPDGNGTDVMGWWAKGVPGKFYISITAC